MQPQIDFGQLKYIQRYILECVFKFWRDSDGNRFDINRLWMESNRQSLKDRFDARHGIYDWAHQMYLKENGVQQICPQEYGHWRETGFAKQTPMDRRQSHRDDIIFYFRNLTTAKKEGKENDARGRMHCTKNIIYTLYFNNM